ncbi:hypothetical protein PF010_g28751 [Phytophthora fragariae]|uniref:Uncharacterized protein n=1 Tax=Phytophthora fragariae TaxID=53985 RepID=A0A6A3QQ92_9STRA|nr:hypothetical protein PF011_g32650 [Phytophthora fragariae]KAE9064081.1 hypothetical protein PF010_g28751 [Phytophthora fragariae]KAE9081120.1 hypothetical protein PF006_g27178 [Phytophthora fragariae]KAE9313359.1 hypothetical protein PF008_g19746 [Phytophthora fragariae]
MVGSRLFTIAPQATLISPAPADAITVLFGLDVPVPDATMIGHTDPDASVVDVNAMFLVVAEVAMTDTP